MRKLAFLSSVLPFVALALMGCEDTAPTAPGNDQSEPSFAQGGRSSRPYSIVELPMLTDSDECWANDITEGGVAIGGCNTFDGMGCDMDYVQAMVWHGDEYFVLPSLGGCETNAADISGRGWIVGTSRTPDGHQHAVLWTDHETLVDLGNPEGDATRGNALNDRGQVAMTSCSDPYHCRGIVWANGSYTDIGDLGGGVTGIEDINAVGQVVGSSTRDDGQYRAYIWQAGAIQDLGTLGGNYSRAFGINNRGQVVGEARDQSGTMHAFIWDKGTMTDLGVSGAYSARALDINEAGVIIGGVFYLGIGGGPIVWRDSGITDLSEIWDTYAYAPTINNRGQIVGQAALPDWSKLVAVIWESGN